MKTRDAGSVYLIASAICKLVEARDQLKGARADRSVDVVRRAIKSAEGALRHAQGMATRGDPTALANPSVRRAQERLAKARGNGEKPAQVDLSAFLRPQAE